MILFMFRSSDQETFGIHKHFLSVEDLLEHGRGAERSWEDTHRRLTVTGARRSIVKGHQRPKDHVSEE